ncbi:hypothetical protein BU26DRAFT_513183 [Trematosphaeria pertusa]|uniref:F-box domain-containing protein n=1 Tax=Trematosphaeria pertusa TaxID=390896 RepID=A0A6A6J373_9PLEO|nr:uncharacterized protein BU26DRAFT_513183 [Trematosphaeria pertusa]KAF2256350.1 hypothetical protein BU26DRAFT_513183 [Trematosphaeria pertusa]
MVNSKNVAFKVNKQTPTSAAPPQAYGTVINCRKPGGKRALKEEKEVKSRRVRLAKVSGAEEWDRKRKRADDPIHEDVANPRPKKLAVSNRDPASSSALAIRERPFAPPRPQLHKPTKFRRGKALAKGVDLDCWFTILSFSDPAQLLEMRAKIASCYRFLRDNPKLWEHSRNYYYGGTLPDPPSELTEFQYAHLRHGHGCMACGTPSTRKTYWAFLRRWCKTCLQSKTIKEQDAMDMFKDANGEDISFISKCLPAGIFDSWGNFVGVGPANAHSLKTVYLYSDVKKLVDDFVKESRDNYVSWHAEMRTWISNRVKVVEERREFARKMELWEDATRQSKSFDYHEKKQARKLFFVDKAAQLVPPISLMEMECCPSYRRAIAIPKDPNMTSWLQLKPKLEKEAATLKSRGGPRERGLYSLSESSTPSIDPF